MGPSHVQGNVEEGIDRLAVQQVFHRAATESENTG